MSTLFIKILPNVNVDIFKMSTFQNVDIWYYYKYQMSCRHPTVIGKCRHFDIMSTFSTFFVNTFLYTYIQHQNKENKYNIYVKVQ